MKRLIKRYSCLLLLAAVLYPSCVDGWEFGDDSMKEPDIAQQVVLDSLFSNRVDAMRVLTSAYACLWYGLPWYWNERGGKMNMGIMEALGDTYQSYLSWDNVNRTYYTGNLDAGKEGGHSKYWYGTNSTNDPNDAEGQWVGIRRAYLFLENVDRVPDMTDEDKARRKAEAKMVIACLHADMFRHFGGLCCVTRAYSPNDEFVIPRSTVKETVQFITDLCDSAYVNLPWQLENPATDDGRFTGAAALGLKIRVLLFAASPLFNDNEPFYTAGTSESVTQHHVWTGGYEPTMWQDVVDACKTFFERQEAEATPNLTTSSFRDAYFKRAGNGGEALISTRIRYDVGHYDEWDYYFFRSIGGGAANPTLEYVDMFPNADGTPFDSSVWETSATAAPAKDPFINRDPRLYETCVVNGMDYNGGKAQCYLGGKERGGNANAYLGGTLSDPDNNGVPNFCTGMGDFKFNLGASPSGGTRGLHSGLHWPYLRLAEIYLSYAEALNEVGKTDEAFAYVDAVRSRAGLTKGLKDANPTKNFTKEAFREEVLRERACEFGLEEVRFYDLIRWKRADDFKKRLHGLLIKQERNNNGVPTGKFTYEKVELFKRYLQDEDGKVNFNPKWYLSAFPIDEVRKGYGLTQNPGW